MPFLWRFLFAFFSFWTMIKCIGFTNAGLIFLFSIRKILKFRRNKGFEQGMLLSTETIISWPQCFFSSWGLPNERKVRNARVPAVSRAGNLDDEYEQARVCNMATAIGHYQWNFHVNRSVFCDSKCFRVFQTLLIKLASICIGVLFPVHVCSVHIQAIFLVLTENLLSGFGGINWGFFARTVKSETKV